MNSPLESATESPSTSIAETCGACGTSIDVGLRFCTACGAAVAQPQSPAVKRNSLVAAVVEYLKSFKQLKNSLLTGLRRWFPFAWRITLLFVLPAIALMLVIAATVAVAGVVHSDLLELSQSDRTKILGEGGGKATSAAFTFIFTPISTGMLILAAVMTFRAKAVYSALGKEYGGGGIPWRATWPLFWAFTWRFLLVFIPAFVICWLLIYKPIVLFGAMTKGDQELVLKFAENAKDFVVLVAAVLASLLPFCDSKLANRGRQ